MKLAYTLSIGIILLALNLKAQSSYQVGSISYLNLNKTIKNDWQINFIGEARTLYLKNITRSKAKLVYDYQFSDVSLLGSKKVGLNNRIVFGATLRFDKDIKKRLTQQFIWFKNYNHIDVTHRFTTDETFSSKNSQVYRLRYRLGLSIPLNGNTLNPKEWYFKYSNEVLNQFQSNNYDLEFRISPALGFNFANQNKVELTTEYRISQFLNNDVGHQFFAVINYYISL